MSQTTKKHSKKIQKARKKLDKAIKVYVKAFCKKQDMEFRYWVADQTGGVAAIADHFFDFQDILLDIDTQQPKGLILKWYDAHMNAIHSGKESFNYKSWTMGYRLNAKDLDTKKPELDSERIAVLSVTHEHGTISEVRAKDIETGQKIPIKSIVYTGGGEYRINF